MKQLKIVPKRNAFETVFCNLFYIVMAQSWLTGSWQLSKIGVAVDYESKTLIILCLFKLI
jgi:hypothetical protein